MDFSRALEIMKDGQKLTRKSWKSKDIWVTVISNWSIPTVHSMELFPNGDKAIEFSVFLAIKTANGRLSPWTPFQTDLLSEDWMLVENL